MNPDESALFYLLASALRAEGRKEEAQLALKHVSELHATRLQAEKHALRHATVVGAR